MVLAKLEEQNKKTREKEEDGREITGPRTCCDIESVTYWRVRQEHARRWGPDQPKVPRRQLLASSLLTSAGLRINFHHPG